MLMTIDEEAKAALARQLEAEHPEWRQGHAPLTPLRSVLGTMLGRLPLETYSRAPWWIMRVQPNAYKRAAAALLREGFESYAPTYKALRPLPLRFIPPKKRANAALYKREVVRRRFDGYLFIRRLFGTFDVNRLFDLQGCGNIVRLSGSPALVPDFDVELMRLEEADGKHDEIYARGACRNYRVTRVEPQWTGESRIVGRLDESDRTVLFVERMGRIAQLIHLADPGQGSR